MAVHQSTTTERPGQPAGCGHLRRRIVSGPRTHEFPTTVALRLAPKQAASRATLTAAGAKMLKTTRTFIPALVLALGCSSGGNEAADEPAEIETEATMTEASGPPPVSGDTVTTESGLQYIVIAEGDGATPQPGQAVIVHYTGWFTDGNKFDSSVDSGEPFQFPLGQGSVIPGWDEGVALMRVGDKRRFIVPSDLAYGERGHSAGIPPNTILIFDVELLDIGQ